MKKLHSVNTKSPKMNLTKRKTPRQPRDTEFFNHIKNMEKIRDSHYLLLRSIIPYDLHLTGQAMIKNKMTSFRLVVSNRAGSDLQTRN